MHTCINYLHYLHFIGCITYVSYTTHIPCITYIEYTTHMAYSAYSTRTLLDITLRTLHSITLHCITLQYIMFQYYTQPYIPLLADHCIALHDITLHYIGCIKLHCIALHALHYKFCFDTGHLCLPFGREATTCHLASLLASINPCKGSVCVCARILLNVRDAPQFFKNPSDYLV